jgi:hypothetical protein
MGLSAGGPSGGLIFPAASPHRIDDTMAKILHAGPPKTKAELREMLAEAVRNTQPETKRQPNSKRDRG